MVGDAHVGFVANELCRQLKVGHAEPGLEECELHERWQI